MSGSKAPTLETPHQLQIPRSSRDRAHHHPPRTGVTLTCSTRVLRVTRSMGLYSSAEGREKVSAATCGWSPGPSPTCHRQHGGKEGSPDAQRAPLVRTEPWTSIWDQKSWQCQEPPVPQPRVLLCWRHEEPRPAGVWPWVVNTTLTVGWDVPPCLCQPSGGQGLRGRGAPTLAMRWLRSGRAASHPQQLFQFPFWLSGGVGPVPHRALPPHGTPCTHLCAPPQPALGEKGTQAALAAAKPPPTENTGAKASSQHRVPPHSPP